MIEILGPYYEMPPAGYRDKRVRGHIYEALVPYSGESDIRRLKLVSAEPGSDLWCAVEKVELNDIRQTEAVPELSLRRGEALVVREAKCRRVVLLSSPPTQWRSAGRSSEAVYLAAPIYSFKDDDQAEHRSRVKAYAYNTLFWLPGDEEHGLREGCVRLDRVQPVHAAVLDAKPVRLTPKALDALTAWYGAYLTNRVPERIRTYRDNALAQLKP